MPTQFDIPYLPIYVRYSRCGTTEGGLLRWQSYAYACPNLEQILQYKAKARSVNLQSLDLGRLAVCADCSKDTVRRDLRSVIGSMRLFAHLVPTITPQEQIRCILDEILERAQWERAPD